MVDPVQEYVRRIRSYVDGRDALEVLEETPPALVQMVSGVADSRLTRRASPEKWSVQEILAHLVDTELVMGYRVRRILQTDGVEIQGFDQNHWALIGHYDRIPVTRSMERIRVQRGANIDLLRSLLPPQLEQHGVHVERGKETVADILQLWAGHDINHRRQIESLVSAAPEAP